MTDLSLDQVMAASPKPSLVCKPGISSTGPQSSSLPAAALMNFLFW
jgi:hypothetical protein